VLRKKANQTSQLRTAICTLNIVQASGYLTRAGMQISAASRACEASRHDALETEVCVADAAGVFSSVSFVAAFLSSAASQCAPHRDLAAECSAWVSFLVAVLSRVAVQASVVAASCKRQASVFIISAAEEEGEEEEAGLLIDRRLAARRLAAPSSVPPGPPGEASSLGNSTALAAAAVAASAAAPVNASVAASASAAAGPPTRGRRPVEPSKTQQVATCVLDVVQAASALSLMGANIEKARQNCEAQQRGSWAAPATTGGIVNGSGGKDGDDDRDVVCAMNIGQVLYGLGSASTFIAAGVSHCTAGLNLEAMCTSGIVGLLATIGGVMAAASGIETTCVRDA